MIPISIQADGDSEYRVRFEQNDGQEIEYRFWIEDNGDIEVLKSQDGFWKQVYDDRAGDKLRQSIMAFHQSRKQTSFDRA